MADFCYTNPTIVPGELLSRRGFSMYSGVDNFDEDFGKNKNHYGTYQEARSKFWRTEIGMINTASTESLDLIDRFDQSIRYRLIPIIDRIERRLSNLRR